MMHKAKILLVDDEKNIRFTLERLLINDGYEVTAVATGEAAVDCFSQEEFDLILLDLMMPGMNGIEVMGVLQEKAPSTIVTLLTAHASLETAVNALRLGAHDYLFKPCEPADLRASVRKGLQKRQQILQQRQIIDQLEQTLTDNLNKLREAVHSPKSTAPLNESLSKPFANDHFLQSGTLILDLMRHVATVDGHFIQLSQIEADLLAYLIQQAPKVASPQKLVRQILGYDSNPKEASELIRAHIYRIRQKIKAAANRDDIIRTVRGVGYTI